MTKEQENKDLLLRDLCARLPYKPYVEVRELFYVVETDHFVKLHQLSTCDIEKFVRDWSIIKPYLRPMSSITGEEKEEYHKSCDNYYDIHFDSVRSIDWLNAHHFDYRGLIEKGLAIAVTDEYNPYIS